MTKEQELRYLAERILSGDRNVRNLDKILLGLRNISRKFPIIYDLGNFAAHASERDRGLVCRRVSNTIISAGYSIATAGITTGWPSPGTLDDALEAGLANLSNNCSYFETLLKSNEKNITKTLKGLFLKINVGAQAFASTKEIDVFKALFSSFCTYVAYDETTLFEQFLGFVENFGVNIKNVYIDRNSLTKFLSLYALERMHNCNVKLPYNDLANLSIGITEDNFGKHKLCVFATGPIKQSLLPNCSIQTTAYISTLDPYDHLDSSLFPIEKGMTFSCGIELNDGLFLRQI